jgi:flagellar biosynthesis/type III secretory pathway M-ring protein FliF/YscJ
MAEFVAVFLLYTFKAAWYWWFAFVVMIFLEGWSEYRKIERTIKMQKEARERDIQKRKEDRENAPRVWTGEEI